MQKQLKQAKPVEGAIKLAIENL